MLECDWWSQCIDVQYTSVNSLLISRKDICGLKSVPLKITLNSISGLSPWNTTYIYHASIIHSVAPKCLSLFQTEEMQLFCP